jgi:CelD/BcsL family acetyltransferase involved in cellulose biosynthesis
MNSQTSGAIATVPFDSGAARVYTGGQYEIAILTAAEDVRALAARATSLVCRPLEHNVFYEPWMLAAAMSTLDESVQVVVISERLSGEVTGIFPLQLAAKFRGLPIRVLKSWRHPYCFLCTPLIAQAHARATVRSFLDWLESPAAPARIVDFELCAADGAFDRLLSSELDARSRWRSVAKTYQRAVFRPGAEQVSGLSSRYLSDLRRRERRLNEIGSRTFRVYETPEDIRRGLDEFMRLEASGWKGREQTALASAGGSREFFLRIGVEAMAQGRFRLLALELSGVTIAMNCYFVAGDGAFGFKMAYDESYAKYSPGLLLLHFAMQHWRTEAQPREWVDSCAVPDHPMMNQLWSERRTLADRVMSPQRLTGLVLDHWEHFARARKLMQRSLRVFRRRS